MEGLSPGPGIVQCFWLRGLITLPSMARGIKLGGDTSVLDINKCIKCIKLFMFFSWFVRNRIQINEENAQRI